jgi:phosphoglycerate dehydrogenase-like enzyme
VVVGAGPIGQEIGRLLSALGFHTTAVRRQAVATPHFDQSVTWGQFDELLPGCDWLVLACPLSEETRGGIDARRLDLLPSHARLANVGRGELVDEAALALRLCDGRLAGAFLDVFSQEPLAQASPLWDLPHVWITPHNCAASQGHEDRIIHKFMHNLRLWLAPASQPIPTTQPQ